MGTEIENWTYLEAGTRLRHNSVGLWPSHSTCSSQAIESVGPADFASFPSAMKAGQGQGDYYVR